MDEIENKETGATIETTEDKATIETTETTAQTPSLMNDGKDTPTAGTKTTPVDVHIKDIVQDKHFQIRKKLNEDTIKRYMSVYSLSNRMPPVKVAKIRQGLVLIDGWHRIAALERLGMETVSVEIIETTEKKAYFMAAIANIEHGLPLKSSEIREVFRAYIKAGEHMTTNKDWLDPELKSYRQIATDLGNLKRHTTIRSWMKKDFPKIARQYSADDSPWKGRGGTPENVKMNTFEIETAEAFNAGLASFRCIQDAEARSRMIELIKGISEEMIKDIPVQPVPAFEDF